MSSNQYLQFQPSTTGFIPVFSLSLFPVNQAFFILLILIYSLSPPEGNQFPTKPSPPPISLFATSSHCCHTPHTGALHTQLGLQYMQKCYCHGLCLPPRCSPHPVLRLQNPWRVTSLVPAHRKPPPPLGSDTLCQPMHIPSAPNGAPTPQTRPQSFPRPKHGLSLPPPVSPLCPSRGRQRLCLLSKKLSLPSITPTTASISTPPAPHCAETLLV